MALIKEKDRTALAQLGTQLTRELDLTLYAEELLQELVDIIAKEEARENVPRHEERRKAGRDSDYARRLVDRSRYVR